MPQYGRRPLTKIALQPTNLNIGFGFEWALKQIRNGYKVTRAGWHGEGMFIYMAPEREAEVNDYDDTASLVAVLGIGAKIKFSECIMMRFANSNFGPWTHRDEDIFTEDWRLWG